MKPKLSNSSALRIVAAAREEFSRRGFDGARMDQIARRAAVNKQLLFYYFHSKRGLFTAVLARGAAELEQALADLPTGGERPLDRIRLALDAQFDFLAAHPDLVTLLTQAGRSEARPLAPAKSCRPWVHTTKSVEPGRYSQRNTTFERNCLKLTPPMWFVTAVSAYG